MGKLTQRLEVLRVRDFRIFFAGYATSNLGSALSPVAFALAMLHSGYSPSDLGFAMAARIVPTVLLLLGGGVLGDRFPRRIMLIVSDCGRTAVQCGVAVCFLMGSPPLTLLLALFALTGVCEALFQPSFNGMVPEMLPEGRVQEGNALIGVARSAAAVAGPALGGTLAAVLSPSAVLLIDAATYLASIGSLLALRIRPAPADARGASPLRQFRDGFRLFGSHPWLWTITLQFTLFNLIVWAPYLVLMPVAAVRFYGGSTALGLISALYGAGSIAGGLLMLGWHPRRPLVAATAITVLAAAPSAALAVRAPLAAVCGGALAAGLALTVFDTLFTSVLQSRIPADSLSRVMSFVLFGAYSVGPLGLAAAGPLAGRLGIGAVLGAGAVWQVVAGSVLLALPAIRATGRGSDAS